MEERARMIVGTAGHVDHGKTSLVRALSGVDTDRLKEEKARGISIELGYAYVPLDGGGMLGIVDVPGHERFVHTMAAGASGIDFALVVIAADDGVMPQTREHLAIVQLLGIRRGAVALTKVDRVARAQVDAARADIARLLAGTPFSDAPVFETCATQAGDAGVVALGAYLREAARELPVKRDDGLFRLAVDRVFTLAGHGTVVTGTVVSGHVDVGASISVAPAGHAARVRSIHAQNRPAQRGRAGERCALNLSGIDKSAISRGDWIVDPRLAEGSARIDATLCLLADAPHALRHWSPVHVHLGTQHQVAQVALLQDDTLAPQQRARVQLVFERPVCTVPGDRFIVRNAQATATIGGGYVLDPFAPSRKRRSPERAARLDAIDTLLDTGAIDALLARATHGLARSHVERLAAMPAERFVLPEQTHRVDLPEGDALWIADGAWQTLLAQMSAALRAFHERAPDEPGVEWSRLRRMAAPSMHIALWRALVDDGCAQGRVVRDAQWLRLPEHTVTLGAADEALANTFVAAIREGRFEPPWVRDLANAHRMPEAEVRQLLRKLARQGDLMQVVHDLFFSREAVQELAAIVARIAREQESGVAATAFRDATGLGRKRAIQLLEFFDRVGYTRFSRGRHLVRPESRWFDVD
jgi:selenocysteine-specific elongation factor